MGNVRERYPQPPPKALISFDFGEVAAGTGVVEFDGFVTEDISGTDYRLSSQTLFSSQIEEVTAYSVAGFNTYRDVVNLDFNLTAFNNSVRLKGTAYIRFTFVVADSSGGGNTPTTKFQVFIRKWDGTTETEIANVETQEVTQAVTTTTITTVIIPITIPATNFAKGDQIRITILGRLKSAGNPGTSNGNLTFGTDPQNRDGTEIVPSTDSTGNRTTNLKAWIPFDLKE